MRARSRVVSGYVDVLGGEEGFGPHLVQHVLDNKFTTAIYERFWRPTVIKYLFGRKLNFDEESGIILRMLDLSPTDRVLDVGCGPGNYTRRIAEKSTEGTVVGIDPSEAMLARAVNHGVSGNLAYVRGDAAELPFRDAKFDAVCCVGVIHLLEDPMVGLDEMVRVLAPGGRVAIGATRSERRESSYRRGITLFGADTLTDAFAERGLTDIDRRLSGHGQFISARKPQ
jgi:SAM-dependent methyltransferase